jgi:uncharacterized metal-binding protein
MPQHIQIDSCIIQQLGVMGVQIISLPTCSENEFLEITELISFILLIYISKMHHAIWSGIGTFSFGGLPVGQ